MKATVLLSLFFTMAGYCCAQKPKASAKEKAPTQAELQQMMNEMQKELAGMSPEDKKRMEEMGIKLPDVKKMQKNAAGVNNAQLQQAYEDEMRIVPEKDAARIASIQTTPANPAAMGAHLQLVLDKAVAAMSPVVKQAGEELYEQLAAQYTAADIGTAAVGLWMAGKNNLSVYVMCRACKDDPGNTDNLSNLSAMLVMNEGEHLAVPLLNNLNRMFPSNSTILNNLGQAWYGLGDITKAGKYLDSAIRIYALHPQATLTKSLIEESKGNKTAAISLVKKSLEHTYSPEKEDRLKKFGEKVNMNSLQLPPRTKSDPLNLGSFKHPPFPKTIDECIVLLPEWELFRENISNEIASLQQQHAVALEEAAAKQKQRTERDIAMVKASLAAGSPQGSFTALPLYIHKAVPKLKAVMEEYTRKSKSWEEKVAAFMNGKGSELRTSYDEKMKLLREEDGAQTGEGLPNRDYCPRYKAATNDFLSAYNTETEQLYIDRLRLMRDYLNEMAYYSMYTNWPESFEVIKLEAKMAWLNTLYAQPPGNFESNTSYGCKTEEKESGKTELAAFDDVACQYHSEMDLLVYSIKTDCSRMTTELNTTFVKLKLKQDMDKESFSDQFMNANVEFRVSAGEKVKLGPVEAGVKLTGGAGFEFTRQGLSDMYLIGGVSAKVGAVGGGTEGRFSIISGQGGFKGTGMFSGKN